MKEINGIPIKLDASNDEKLFESLFQKNGSAYSVLDTRFNNTENSHSAKAFEENSNEIALQNPFGQNSIFYTELKGDFFEGFVDMIPILWKLGAPMPEFPEKEEKGIKLDQVIVQAQKKIDPKLFNYAEYGIKGQEGQNYWEYWKNNFAGQAILNKKEGYIDAEKLFFDKDSKGFNIYIPYKEDNKVSLNNPDIEYLKANAIIKLTQLDSDAFVIILSNLAHSKRKLHVQSIFKRLLKEIEQNINKNIPFLFDLPIDLLRLFSFKTINDIFLNIVKEEFIPYYRETILINILKVLPEKEDFNATSFLNSLLKPLENESNSFYRLYDKMNDWGGENNFSQLIIEFTKIWFVSAYSNPLDKVFEKYEPSSPIAYYQNYILGFRNDNFDFDFQGNNVLLIQEKVIKEGENVGKKQTCHVFQPVEVKNLDETEAENLKLFEGVKIPAFYLKAFDDKSIWENFEKAVWLTVDVVSTFSGIGNLAKLRYLLRTEKTAYIIIKTVFGAIQVAAGTVSIGISLIENSGNKNLINKIREYLFWVEICTLGADILSTKILSKKAKEAEEALYVYRKTVTNEDELKQIDEFERHLNEVEQFDFLENWDNLPVSRKGYLGGKTLRRNEIQFWIDEVATISKGKSKLILLPKEHKILQGKVAGFSPFDGNIYVQRGLTEYEIFHEFKHFEEYSKLGKDEYIKGMKRISGDPGLDLIRTYKREKYVFDEIKKNKSRFNQEQLNDAQKYIERVIKKCENAGIDVNKI